MRPHPPEHELSPSPLRKRAEAVLEKNPQEISHLTSDEAQRLLYDLQVHQVELKLQNEELRRSQIELQAAREKYEALYDLAPVGYVTLDTKGTILEANLSAAAMLGRSRRDLIGTPLTRFVAFDAQDTFYLHRRQVFESDTYHSCDLSMQRSDGSAFIACLESRSIWGPDEGDQQCLTTLSDLSVRDQEENTRRQITERLTSLGTFAAGLAHELNNPLQAMIFTAEYARGVLETARDHAEVRDCLTEILSDADRCAQNVRHVLNFARQSTRDKSVLDLHVLIQAAHDLTQSYAEQSGVAMRLLLTQTPPLVVGNREDLELALVNLMRNAVEASPSGKEIVIQTTTTAATQVQIRIHNWGAELSDVDRRQVFDPFYTTRQDTGGTGLGLSLTHRIIMDHGGAIDLQSVAGRGTTVYVQFPLASSSQTSPKV